MSVLVIGSVAIDTIETQEGGCKNILGGSAVYFSLACSLFAKVNLTAVVGEDFPEDNLNFLKKRNIDLTGLEQKKGKTFRWHGKYFSDLNKRETVKLDLGVFGNFNPCMPEKYKKSKYLFLANIDPVLQGKILSSLKSCEITAADTMDHWIKTRRPELVSLLKKVDILMLNDQESQLISGLNNLISAGKWIQKNGPENVIIKKGEHGLLLFEKDIFFAVPAYPVEKVFDPTGAGDSFAGAVIGYLSSISSNSSGNLRKASVYGQVIASFCVEDFGVKRLASLTMEEVEERFNEFKKITYF